ncbi:hypothetical protein [Streptomyces sp. NPDC048659]|uniref:hypothetical protein n=1 Tax=Streptomyces sp. NPDC048659 TaxID=3155489 RepID=UPI00342F4EF8
MVFTSPPAERDGVGGGVEDFGETDGDAAAGLDERGVADGHPRPERGQHDPDTGEALAQASG